jgi:anaerobic selenocysteine-containing dehydrogenase
MAMENPAPLARAGFVGSPVEAAFALFQAMLTETSGVVFAVDDYADVLSRIDTPDKKIHLALPDLLAELAKLLESRADEPDADYPFVLSAGERRSFTANTIIRDPSWRKVDAEGALRIGVDDAARLGIRSGEHVRLSTKGGSVVVAIDITDTMQSGHVSLPNGLGLDYPGSDGAHTTGVAANELTRAEDRDPFVGTPWHKHVAARVERIEHLEH